MTILREMRSLRERAASARNGRMRFPLPALGPYSQSLRIGPLVWLTALTAPVARTNPRHRIVTSFKGMRLFRLFTYPRFTVFRLKGSFGQKLSQGFGE